MCVNTCAWVIDNYFGKKIIELGIFPWKIKVVFFSCYMLTPRNFNIWIPSHTPKPMKLELLVVEHRYQ